MEGVDVELSYVCRPEINEAQALLEDVTEWLRRPESTMLIDVAATYRRRATITTALKPITKDLRTWAWGLLQRQNKRLDIKARKQRFFYSSWGINEANRKEENVGRAQRRMWKLLTT